MELGIAGRKALVTGGSMGIGRACAAALVAEGVDVAIVARDAARLQAAAAELAKSFAGRIVPVQGDLSRAEDVSRAVARAKEVLGQIDILVNNAGAAPNGRIADIDDATWQASFDLKLMGYVRCARAVMDDMRARRWGRIVNIIGRGGHHPSARYVAGGAINAALLNLTQALAEECGPDNVLVNGVNPASTRTPRQETLVRQRMAITGQTAEQVRAASVANIPLGRIAEPEDIAGMVAFLCSEKAGFVNGALIEVDGGASRAL